MTQSLDRNIKYAVPFDQTGKRCYTGTDYRIVSASVKTMFDKAELFTLLETNEAQLCSFSPLLRRCGYSRSGLVLLTPKLATAKYKHKLPHTNQQIMFTPVCLLPRWVIDARSDFLINTGSTNIELTALAMSRLKNKQTRDAFYVAIEIGPVAKRSSFLLSVLGIDANNIYPSRVDPLSHDE